MTPKALFFDFDGTLADTAECIVATMKGTFKELGLSEPDEEAIHQTIGLPLVQSLQRLGYFSDEEAWNTVDLYHQQFARFQATHVGLFPNVVETLSALRERGTALAVVTSRSLGTLQEIMEEHGIQGFFETLMTTTDGLPSKPAPDMVLALLGRLNLRPEDAWVVGDTTYDLQMGQSAGCVTVGVTFGNHSREQLQPFATHLIDHFEDLLSL